MQARVVRMLKQPEKANLRNENAISRFNDLLTRAKLERSRRGGRQTRKCVIEAHVKWLQRLQQKIAPKQKENTFMAMK